MDGSQASMDSAKYLSQINDPDQMDVTVLTVIGLPKMTLANAESNSVAQYTAQCRSANEKTFEWTRMVFKDCNAVLRHVSMQGHIGNCIVSAADTLRAELIVVGATGRSRHEHLSLGSVSEYVAMHAMGSVLVVRPNNHPNQNSDVTKIIVAYDDSSGAKAAIQRVGMIKWSPNTEIEVLAVAQLHVMHEMDSESIEYPVTEEETEAIESYADRVVEELRGRGIRAHAKIEQARHVGIQIAAEARASHADLVVVGAQGQSGIARTPLGSVAQYVVRHTIQPVWIVRDQN